jgi:hypothetical protein
MIRRNTAGQVIYLPQLTTTDGAPVESAASITVAKDGSEAASAGTLTHVANGVWKYMPTQSETDAAIVGLILTASGGVPVVLNLITTAADTAAVAFGANTTTPPTPNQIMGGLVTGTQPAGSLARFVRDIKQADVLFEGTIVTATSDTAELNGDATTVCVGQLITIGEEGDTERQSRFITAFDPATKIVTLDQPWCVVPDDGANYQIKTQRNPLLGRLTGAIANTFGGLLANLATMIENVSGWRWTAKALEEGPSGGGAVVNVLPAVGIVADRKPGLTLYPKVGETITQSITVYQTDGITPVDMSAKTLEIVFEDRRGVDVAVIANSAITVGGDDDNVITFAYPSAVTAAERLLKFALRDTGAPKTVYLEGIASVTRAAQVDP